MSQPHIGETPGQDQVQPQVNVFPWPCAFFVHRVFLASFVHKSPDSLFPRRTPSGRTPTSHCSYGESPPPIIHFQPHVISTQVGAGSTPPGVDLDRVAASISSGSLASLAAPGSSSGATPTSGTSSGQPPPPSSRQFGGRIAVAISGAAQNLKSR